MVFFVRVCHRGSKHVPKGVDTHLPRAMAPQLIAKQYEGLGLLVFVVFVQEFSASGEKTELSVGHTVKNLPGAAGHPCGVRGSQQPKQRTGYRSLHTYIRDRIPCLADDATAGHPSGVRVLGLLVQEPDRAGHRLHRGSTSVHARDASLDRWCLCSSCWAPQFFPKGLFASTDEDVNDGQFQFFAPQFAVGAQRRNDPSALFHDSHDFYQQLS